VSTESHDSRPEPQGGAGPSTSKPNWLTSKRLNRAKWWAILLVLALICVIIQGQIVVFAICVLVSLPIIVLVSVRRLHDVDKSAWWLVPLWLAPAVLDIGSEFLDASWGLTAPVLVANAILQGWALFELGFRPGTLGPNRFGPDPLGPARDPRTGQFGFAKRAIAILVAALLVAYPNLFRQLRIASGSQMPTLFAGEYVFYSNFERLYPRQKVRYGDMVAFRLPKDKSVIYSDRVVGLPGDHIQMIEGHLHLNGTAVKRARVDDFVDTESGDPVKRWRETLPNGVSYETLDLVDRGFLDNTAVYVVPAGHFFAMGDNRDNATDSRVLSQVGYVPLENLVGRAQFISMSVGAGESAWHVWRWPYLVRWNRLFTVVR
jgi:signal peptidase I